MVTHQLNNEDDFTEGGYFTDDIGRSLCKWAWDAENTTLSVRCGAYGRELNLSDHGRVDRLSDEELQHRLIDIAKSTGEDIRGEPFGE